MSEHKRLACSACGAEYDGVLMEDEPTECGYCGHCRLNVIGPATGKEPRTSN